MFCQFQHVCAAEDAHKQSAANCERQPDVPQIDAPGEQRGGCRTENLTGPRTDCQFHIDSQHQVQHRDDQKPAADTEHARQKSDTRPCT